MSEDIPNKADIGTVFKRLRAIPSNKTCFDCGAKNPTWSSVTYGVFICMDCSAVHRSLGVHVSFVRSTQLDTNWTWLQLRGMQIGGNANATAFFQQHGCTSTDAQQKYNSRAAQLYREKIHHSAHAAMRLHGTKVHIDTCSSSESHVGSPENKEVDFFQEIAQSSQKYHHPETESNLQNGSALHSVTLVAQDNGETGEGPKVESLLSSSPTAEVAKVSEPRKATIGSRKPATNKKGVGTRKGLGAQKVSSNFNEIEQQAQRVDQMKEQARQQQMAKPLSPMEEQQHIASVRLAYQDLSLQQKQTEDKLRQTDPRKAEHMERLGMGFRTPGQTGTKSISHSAASNMKVIQQETPNSGSSSSGSSSLLRSRDLDDDFEFVGFTSGPPKYGDSPFLSRLESKERNTGTGNRDLWDDKMDQKASFIETILPLEKDDSAGRSRRGISSSSSTSALSSSSSSTSPGDQAQKKFGNAKSISSEQFFGPSRDFDYERRANLAKFEGSSSISSADYFGGGMQTRNMDQNFAGPNLYDIKEGVKDGVSKVAGRLSSLANGVMTSLQEKYGY